MPDPSAIRSRHFEVHCLAWAALNHFLSADLLREFSEALVTAVGGGEFDLRQLFEDELIGSAEGLESWAVRPLEVKSPLGQYLQNRIRYLIWMNDRELFYDANQPQPAGPINPATVEAALRLGQCDLKVVRQLTREFKFPLSTSIETLLLVIKQTSELCDAKNKAEKSGRVIELCDKIEMPLGSVVVKHLGDLCVDADQWDMALEFYHASSRRLDGDNLDAWRKYHDLLKIIVEQSIGAALRAARGSANAVAYLAPRVQAATLSKSLLFLLNASLDAYAAETLALEPLRFTPDRRASILEQPLLLQTQDLSSAFEAWTQREYQSAHSHFWSVLRRQIALGSANDTRMTQAYYASCVFNSLDKTVDRELDRSFFVMGLRLLVQSGQTSLAEKLEWSDQLVRAYVTDEVVAQLLSHTEAVPASREERLGVTVELLRGWCLTLPAEGSELAARMLSFIAQIATTHKSSFYGRHNVGGRSIEVLREVAERRPEFRDRVANDVTPAILSKFESDEWWTGTAEAFKLAAEYLDVLKPNDVGDILGATLDLLDKQDPQRDQWVIVSPAIDLLVEPTVRQIAKDDKQLDSRIVSTILRFGLNQKTEYTRLLLYLYRFDLRSVYQPPMLLQLRQVVDEVRKQALTVHASNAMDNVRALLLASSAAGLDGVKDALKSIELALVSALGDPRRLALAFPYAYETFIILAERQEQIALDISVSAAEFRGWLFPLVDRIVEVWGRAAKNPAIFAPMAFPPKTTPSPVVVHNWAFGSIAFAKSLGVQEKVAAALDAASKEPVLEGPIRLARAVRLGPGELDGLNPASIRLDNAETFYSALGQRLSALQLAAPELSDSVIDALLAQCLRLGPNPLDAAVFVAAGESKLYQLRDTSDYRHYVRRVKGNRELRLVLMPFLESGKPKA
jgi:hypothetical protein